VDSSTSAVLVSVVLFETSRIVPGLAVVAAACAREGAELVVDAYHALGVVPFSVADLADAWVLGGGYKYLQLGEGNAFLRLPPHADRFRPVVTGWYAEFADLADEPDPDRVGYGVGAVRFAGATYDPTSHYRAARVLDFFVDRGLSASRLREISLHQNTVLAEAFDALDVAPEVVTRDRGVSREAFGGFLALRSPRAAELQRVLAERGVDTDSRGVYLRFGPAPYLADTQLTDAIGALGEVLRSV
jgi:kynureninase